MNHRAFNHSLWFSALQKALPTPAVVLKAEHYGALGIVRSLGQVGVPVTVVDESPRNVAAASRYCARHVPCDVESMPVEEALETLRRISEKAGCKPVLIPTTDETAIFVAENAGQLSRHFLFPQQTNGPTKALLDKQRLIRIATSLGVPVPRTFFPRDRGEVIKYALEIRFPFLIKGIDGKKLERATGRKMFVVRNERMLEQVLAQLPHDQATNVMVQEYIKDAERNYWLFNGYFDEASNCLAVFTGRKLRQNPAHAGMMSLGVTEWNVTVARSAVSFMKQIRYTGPVDIDFCFDAADGQYKVLDVNPRVGASFRLFVDREGLDMVRVYYLHLTGCPIPSPVPVAKRTWMVEDKDLRSSYEYWKEGSLTVGIWLRSMLGIDEFGYFAFHDLRPFRVMVAGHVKKLFRRMTFLKSLQPQSKGRQKRMSGGGELPEPALIASAGSLNPYNVLRSLGMSGICSTVFSSDPRDMMFSSRYCKRYEVLPEFGRETEEEILQVLCEHGRDMGTRPPLFYSSDQELEFVWRNRDTLSEYYRFLLPPNEVFESLFDKAKFSFFAQSRGIPVPKSMVCQSLEELKANLENIRFPCIVKPALARHWAWKTDKHMRKFGWYKTALRRFDDEASLYDFCRHLPHQDEGFLVQEYLDGRDDSLYSFNGYFDQESRCLAAFVGRKIRTFPIHTGGSAFIRTVDHSELMAFGVDILQKLGYRGIVKVDLKQDMRTGQYFVLEINTRFSLWQFLGACAGCNLARIAYDHLMGRPVDHSMTREDSARLIHVKRDLRSFAGYRKTGEWNLRSYIASLRGRKFYAVWNPQDPLPFVSSLLTFARRLPALARKRYLSRGRRQKEAPVSIRRSHAPKVDAEPGRCPQ